MIRYGLVWSGLVRFVSHAFVGLFSSSGHAFFSAGRATRGRSGQMDPYKTSATEPPNHGSESLRAVGVFLRVKGPPTGSRARDPTLRPDRAASLWRKQKADPHESQGQAKYTPFYLFLVRGSLSLKRDNNGLRVNVVDGTVVGISLPYTVGKLWFFLPFQTCFI